MRIATRCAVAPRALYIPSARAQGAPGGTGAGGNIAGGSDLTGWLWTGLIERISQDRRSWPCGEVRKRVRSRSY
jgi:hypothetical protein